ncbi:MAG: DUF2807 domain-containing protein [Bacteroidota bacterium]
MEKRLSGNITMLKIRICLLIAASLVVVSGCTKDGGLCFTSNGQQVRQVRNLTDFTQIDIQNNVNLILSPDSANHAEVQVEAGQNIIGGISTRVVDGQLQIRNNNKCNWLRDYSRPVNVYVSNSKLWKINYNGSGNVSSAGILQQDSLSIVVYGGCGTIDLDLDIWQGNFSLTMGTVDFRLRGTCAITSVFSADYGLYDARELKTGYTFITNKGTNDCYVQAVNELEATIGSIGNIYYKNEPKSMKVVINGSGQVLPL